LRHGKSMCTQQDEVNAKLKPEAALAQRNAHLIAMAPHLLNRKLWDLSESQTSSRRHVFMNASSSGYMTEAMTRGGLSPYARPARIQGRV